METTDFHSPTSWNKYVSSVRPTRVHMTNASARYVSRICLDWTTRLSMACENLTASTGILFCFSVLYESNIFAYTKAFMWFCNNSMGLEHKSLLSPRFINRCILSVSRTGYIVTFAFRIYPRWNAHGMIQSEVLRTPESAKRAIYPIH